MVLTNAQKKSLKSQTHALKPVVSLGKAGLSGSVLDEIESALNHHELIKVKVAASDREEKEAIIAEIAEKTHSEIIQKIGYIAVFYRENPDKKQFSAS